jgi:uncharacterized membrane protein YccF (DUF307 family)
MGRNSDDDLSKSNELAISSNIGKSLPEQWDPAPVESRSERDVKPAPRRDVQPFQHSPAPYQQPAIQIPPPAQPAPPMQVNPTQSLNVTVNPQIVPMIVTGSAGPPLIARVLWYVFVGWWLSAMVIVLGYFLMLTIIGIPAAFALFNRIPQALTLRPRTVRYGFEMRNGVTYLTAATLQQRPWYWRTLYFLLIGWWFGAVWLVAAWAIGLLVITLPITFLMYNRTSAVMTLQRH